MESLANRKVNNFHYMNDFHQLVVKNLLFMDEFV